MVWQNTRSTSSTPRATPISVARWSASSAWLTARWCWSMPPRARCRNQNRRHQSPQVGFKRSSSSTRWTGTPSHRGRNEVFDLFAALDATEEQLDFPILYGSAKQVGWPTSRKDPRIGMAPRSTWSSGTCTVRSKTDHSACWERSSRPTYLGRIVTGRFFGFCQIQPAGRGARSQRLIDRGGRATKVLAFRGLERAPIEEGFADNIISIAGLPEDRLAHVCAPR